jgi:hypothetical protein
MNPIVDIQVTKLSRKTKTLSFNISFDGEEPLSFYSAESRITVSNALNPSDVRLDIRGEDLDLDSLPEALGFLSELYSAGLI